MNWKLRVDYFQALSEEDLSLFAPPREVMLAASSYNTVLELLSEGQFEASQERIRQISTDYPLFAQASHLYAVLLASAGEFEEAEAQFKRVRLLELSEEESRHLEEELAAVLKETSRIRRERERLKQRESMLLPIRAEMAASILKKASPPQKGRWKKSNDAFHAEADEAYALYQEDQAKERRKTAIMVISALALAIALLLFFFFIVRPGILRRQRKQAELSSRLDYLENAVRELAGKDQGAADLWEKYADWLKEAQTQK